MQLTYAMDAGMSQSAIGECRLRFSLIKASTESHYLASSISVGAFLSEKGR
jgi:hypothetical protein